MVVPSRLHRNFKFLKKLKRADKKQRRKLLETAEKDSILCVCDCANNILKGNINLKPKEKKQLSRHKEVLRTLAKGKGTRNIKKKRELLIQKGGFLPMLLAPILSVAGGLLSNLIEGRS
jgi:hypothetical protein